MSINIPTIFPQKCEIFINKLHFCTNMILTKADLELLHQMGLGMRNISSLVPALHKNKTQIYRIVASLVKKGFLESIHEGTINIGSKVHISLLLQLLAQAPAILTPLSGSGISILTAIIEPHTIPEINILTHLQDSIIYRKLKQGRYIQLVHKKENTYALNEKIWPLAKQFLQELQLYESSVDFRVPINAVIYHKTDSEIIFSLKEEYDAALTAFSAYAAYGIKLLTHRNFYYLPKKSLSEKEIFIHSLYVAEKEKSVRYYIYTALFYLKYKNKLLTIKSPALHSLLEILKGKVIPGFPKLEEIKEKAEIYDIAV